MIFYDFSKKSIMQSTYRPTLSYFEQNTAYKNLYLLQNLYFQIFKNNLKSHYMHKCENLWYIFCEKNEIQVVKEK